MAAAVASPSPAPSMSLEALEARKGVQSYLQGRVGNKSSSSAKPFTVPVIDLTRSFSSNLEDRKAVAAQIRDACENSGFFQITGHGVPEEVRQNILKQAERFFHLPVEKKEALHVKYSNMMRGWEPADYSYVDPEDWARGGAPENKEGFNWNYEEAFDRSGGDGKYVELDGSQKNGNVWPAEKDLPGFYDGIKEYYGVLMDLSRHLFRVIALSLDLEENYFDNMMTHPGAIARLMYYPPNKDPKPLSTEKDKEIGLGAHTDYECFTLLLVSSPPGLEILSPDNEWVPAPAVEGGFIVNIADFLMRWTNDRYKSTIHRVVNRTPASRYSVPFFFSVNYEEVITTLPTCITPENPEKYAPIQAGKYVLERLLATTKDGKDEERS